VSEGGGEVLSVEGAKELAVVGLVSVEGVADEGGLTVQ